MSWNLHGSALAAEDNGRHYTVDRIFDGEVEKTSDEAVKEQIRGAQKATTAIIATLTKEEQHATYGTLQHGKFNVSATGHVHTEGTSISFINVSVSYDRNAE